MTEEQDKQMLSALKSIAASLKALSDLGDYISGLTETIQVLFQPPPSGPYRRDEQGQLVRYRVAVEHSYGWGMGTMAYATHDEAQAWVDRQVLDGKHHYLVVVENIPFRAEDYQEPQGQTNATVQP